MNIFVTHKNPIIASQNLCDRHVCKMILETTQILVSGLRQHGCPTQKLPKNKLGKPYGKGYPHHPCTRWAMETRENFLWTIKHGIGIGMEFTLRYGKIHACAKSINHIINSGIWKFIPSGSLTDFVMAMPEKYKSSDPVQSYRNYYLGEKREFATWKNTTPPEWWI